MMTNELNERIGLHRYAVIAEALPVRLTGAERGAVVKAIAGRLHAHPDGSHRTYSRATIDRWVRAWRAGGLDGLRPQARADLGSVRVHPELADVVAALRIEIPARSGAQIADIVWHRYGVRISERTVRAQLHRRGLHRAALAAEPKVFGRYEASYPNQRWITDVLVGPFVPFPKSVMSVRARLFLIVDDHAADERRHGLHLTVRRAARRATNPRTTTPNPYSPTTPSPDFTASPTGYPASSTTPPSPP
jgi:putative transposase